MMNSIFKNTVWLTLPFCFGILFAPKIIAGGCKVNDPDIAGHYSGDCKNGFAHGYGSAKSKDKYQGGFKNGLEHGKGVYTFASGENYEGRWREGKENGFGIMTMPKGSSFIANYENQGKWIGDYYVVQGLVENNDFKQPCYDEANCEVLRLADEETAGKQAEQELADDAESTYERAIKLADAFKCKEALKFDRQAQSLDGKEHSDSDKSNGYRISFSSCQDDIAFNNILHSKNPQAMYLAAGKYSRDGSSSRATQIYEKIIDRFPSSGWAVKANDQLNGAQNASRAASSNSNNNANTRQLCEAQKQTCIASCPREPYPFQNNPEGSCAYNCRSISCN